MFDSSMVNEPSGLEPLKFYCMVTGKKILKSGNGNKWKLREEFLTQRKVFNAEVQRAKRTVWKKKQTEIEELESRDQKLFSREIGKIGVGQDRRNEIPMEVKLPSVEINNNTQEVLSVWENGFETLLNGQANEVSNTRASVSQHADSYDENDPANDILNSDIRESELKATIKQMKLNKATV